MRPIIITLSKDELYICQVFAHIMRQQEKTGQFKDTSNRQKDQYLIGLCGEMAAAKWLNIFYTPKPLSLRTIPDVGNFDVKTSIHPNVILGQEDSKMKRITIAVQKVGENQWQINGYFHNQMIVRDIPLRQLQPNRPEVYFIPFDKLSDPEELYI